MKRIIYTNNDGILSIVIPSTEALSLMSIDDVATKSVPAGLAYEIVDTSTIPSDREFRGAWEKVGKDVNVNNVKAIDIAKDKLRVWRKPEFVENDIKLQTSLVDNDDILKQDAVAHRKFLRDLPEECDGKTVEELKDLLKQYK